MSNGPACKSTQYIDNLQSFVIDNCISKMDYYARIGGKIFFMKHSVIVREGAVGG